MDFLRDLFCELFLGGSRGWWSLRNFKCQRLLRKWHSWTSFRQTRTPYVNIVWRECHITKRRCVDNFALELLIHIPNMFESPKTDTRHRIWQISVVLLHVLFHTLVEQSVLLFVKFDCIIRFASTTLCCVVSFFSSILLVASSFRSDFLVGCVKRASRASSTPSERRSEKTTRMSQDHFPSSMIDVYVCLRKNIYSTSIYDWMEEERKQQTSRSRFGAACVSMKKKNCSFVHYIGVTWAYFTMCVYLTRIFFLFCSPRLHLSAYI